MQHLVKAYEAVLTEPWGTPRAGTEKQWFLVYDPQLILQVRVAKEEFRLVTQKHMVDWHELNLETVLIDWLEQLPYKEAYYIEPDTLKSQLEGALPTYLKQRIQALLTQIQNPKSILAITHAETLHGWVKLSSLLTAELTNQVPGRLLTFFPGVNRGFTYSMLGSNDNWSYLARPITATR